ncbi:hypothetical protein Q0M94_11910 [Deinococcus radiomollis]|uniref:hypothetical protein n=1 Tax=Deinococcus radiomollis TaxID=468916 RepID=UPI003891BAA9
MKLFQLLPVLCLGSAIAGSFALTPARTASLDIRKISDTELAKYSNYRVVAADYPYLEIYPAKGAPNDTWFQQHCQQAVLLIRR